MFSLKEDYFEDICKFRDYLRIGWVGYLWLWGINVFVMNLF